ncbi:hypothetical protein N6H14_04905 [Paenibacillus sp. CC-CFT747]|nr:hypothetical protein N6H14_04905 [Paenibacillus sp. CC-CFT747]
MDNRELQKLLRGLDLSGGGWACIVDEEGKVVSTAASSDTPAWLDPALLKGEKGSIERTINGKSMLVTYSKSPTNDWTYLVAQPVRVVLQKVLYIKKITFSLAFLFLALGLIYAYLIAYRNSRPLKGILDTLRERAGAADPAGRDAYRFIRDHVTRLLENNSDLEERIAREAPSSRRLRLSGCCAAIIPPRRTRPSC